MKIVSARDAKLPELLEKLDSDPAEEIFITNDDKPKYKLVRVAEEAPAQPKIPRDKIFGYGKDKHVFPPDFDEKFVAMDAEILKMFSDTYEVNK